LVVAVATPLARSRHHAWPWYWIVPAAQPHPQYPPTGATAIDHVKNPLGGLAGLAADLGPALASAGRAELLQAVTKAVRDRFATAACSLALVDEDGERRVFVAAAGAGAEVVVGMRIPGRSGIAGWVLASGPADRAQRRRPRPALGPRCRRAHRLSARSILAMPMEGSQPTLGVLEVLDRDGAGDLDADQGQLLALLPGRRPWWSSRHACSPIWARNAFPVNQSWPREVMSWVA
jgi:hypothetical protein